MSLPKLAHVLRDRVVLLDELVDRHESTSDSKNEVIVFDFHDNLLREIVIVA